MIPIKKYQDKNLIELVKSLFGSIYVSECYGTKDLMLYEIASAELEKRGYEVVETKGLSIKKGSDKNE